MKKITLTIDGKEYPCRVTMGALLEFKRTTGKDADQMSADNLEELLHLIWCCVKSASRADGIDFDCPAETFCDHITMEDVQSWSALTAGVEKKKG